MCTSWWQRVITAWAVRGQPYPAVGAELPVRFNLASAITAFLEELVKFLLALEHRGLYPALLGLLLYLVVHGVLPSRQFLHNSGQEFRQLHETQFLQSCIRFTTLDVWYNVKF
jgi:hypothetical protein